MTPILGRIQDRKTDLAKLRIILVFGGGIDHSDIHRHPRCNLRVTVVCADFVFAAKVDDRGQPPSLCVLPTIRGQEFTSGPASHPPFLLLGGPRAR